MSSGPSPTDLIERLKEIHDVAAVEDLRGRVGVSVRSLQRWQKEGWPQSAAEVLDLLTQTGLIRPGEGTPGVASTEILLASLAAGVGDLVESHRAALADLQDVRTRLARAEEALTVPPAATKRRRRDKR